MIGIYKIVSPSGKVYIGQSWDILNRWATAYKTMNCKGQKLLYNSFKKYGAENHVFEIILEIKEEATQKLLDEKEIYYYNQYKEAGIFMLNIMVPGKGVGRHSEESKKLMSVNSRKPKNKSLPVTQFDLKGKKLKSWNSVIEASKEIDIPVSSILTAIKYPNTSKNGFFFRKYIQDSDIVITSKKPVYKIIRYDENNNVLKEWSSVNDAMDEINKLLGKIVFFGKNKNKLAKLTWK